MFQHSFMTFPMCFVLVLEVKCFHVKIIANSHAVVRNNTKRFMYILPRFPNGVCMCAKLLQSYLTLHDPVDYSPPGSSVHGILQARILEWIAIPSSRGSSQPSDQTHISHISSTGRWVLYHQHHLGSPVLLYRTLSLSTGSENRGRMANYLFFSFLIKL